MARKEFWTGETFFGAAGFAVTIATIIIGVILHAGLLAYRVDALEKSFAGVAAIHAAHEQRMTTIETTVQANFASADKRETLLERDFGDIKGKLDSIQAALNQSLQSTHRKGDSP